MSTTVLELIQCAELNLKTIFPESILSNPTVAMAMEQLADGIEALNNGMTSHDVIQQHAFGPLNTGKKEGGDSG